MQNYQNMYRFKMKPIQPKGDHNFSRNFHWSQNLHIENSITKLQEMIQDLINTIKNSHQRNNTEMYRQQSEFDDYQQVTYQNSIEIEDRFRLIEIKVPILKNKQKNSQERKYEIFDWLSQMCRVILSASFQLLLEGRLNFRITKVYCSENLLVHIVNLIKKNDLSKEQIKDINVFLKDDLLPYFQRKYPQSQTSQGNLRLSNKLQTIDNYLNNSNDIVFRSKVEFQYNEEGIYNRQIMMVLNYIIANPNKQTDNQNKNMALSDIRGHKEVMKREVNKTNLQPEIFEKNELKKQKQEQASIYSLFEEDMEKLFKSIESEEELIRMKEKMSVDQYLQEYPEALKPMDQAKQQHYKEKVRQYTKYAIGRKISESVPQYSYEELRSQNLIVRNSQVLRILDKWCTHLRSKFQKAESIIEERDQPFRMQDGSQSYLPKTHRILLKKIMKKQEQKLVSFLEQVMENNYGFQQKIAKYDLPKQMQWYQKNESTVGVFTSVLFQNTESYIISYLNILIHTLLETTRYFNEIIHIENRYKNKRKSKNKKYKKNDFDIFEELIEQVCSNESEIEELMGYLDKTINKEKQINYELVPQLVTFRIGDLVRCKCASKETQIIAIYNQIMRISDSPSALWKVVRIKNRLSEGTKDILINVNYRKQIMAEIQLRVGQSKQKFIVCSSNFTHYIYELQRSEFGPISEMANIWMGIDNRASFFKSTCKKLFNRQKKQNLIHQCIPGKQPNIKQQMFPFICYICKKLWTHQNFIYDHVQCLSCHESICGHCRVEADSSIIKYKLNQSLGDKLESTEIVRFQDGIPDNGCCIMLYSKEIKINFFRKIIYEYKSYLFEILQNQQSSLIAQITSEKQIKQFMRSHIVLSFDNDPKSIKQTDKTNITAKQFFVPKAFREIIDKKKSSIMLEKKDIQDCDLEKIDTTYEVLKINFSQNFIKSFELIIEKFPNVQIVVMVNNSVKRIPPEINKLAKLQYLDLSKNQLQYVPDELSSLTFLEDLDLSFNKIEKLPKDIHKLHNLSDLIMSHNRIRQVEQLPHNIRKLDLQHNRIEGTINLNHEKLVVLNLSINKIQKIDNLSESSNLRKMDIFSNRLKTLKLFNLFKLQFLNASKNQLESIVISYDTPEKSPLKALNLKNNKLISLDEQFYKNLCHLESLNLSSNPLKKITEDIFLAKQLDQLYISNIKKPMKKVTTTNEESQFIQQDEILPSKIHNYLSQLNYIDLSNNELEEIPKVLEKMNHVKEINLCKNKIKRIDISISIDDLDLSYNELDSFTEEDAQKLASLKILNISHNNFYENDVNITKIKAIMKNLNTETLFDQGVTVLNQSKAREDLKSIQKREEKREDSESGNQILLPLLKDSRSINETTLPPKKDIELTNQPLLPPVYPIPQENKVIQEDVEIKQALQ